MRRLVKLFAVASLMIGTTSCFAGTHLTQQQCNDYPFTRLKGPVTHKQLMNELSELESVGYNPGDGDQSDYPAPLQKAEKKLRAEYRSDCTSASSQKMSSIQAN